MKNKFRFLILFALTTGAVALTAISAWAPKFVPRGGN